MRVGVLVNEFDTLVPSQTTAMLIQQFSQLADETFVFGVGDLFSDISGVGGALRSGLNTCGTTEEQIEQLKNQSPEVRSLSDFDLLVIRTNPARDRRAWAHRGALELLSALEDAGVRVVNRPGGLMVAESKLFLSRLPAGTVPLMIASSSETQLRDFVQKAPGPCVLKPASGTRGRGVFKVTPSTPNLGSIVELLLEQGHVIAQHFVPEAVDGDLRVVVLDGQVLEIDGAVAAIRRVPKGGDFRSNIHAGGRAEPGVVTDAQRGVVHQIAPLLKKTGIRLAGFDFIGSLLCEINVFSTGGLRDAEAFTKKAFSQRVAQQLVNHAW